MYGRAAWPDVGLLAGWGFNLRQDGQLRCHGPGDRIYLAPDFAKAIALGSVLVFNAINYSVLNEPPERSRY